jgi:hypothetical protein
MMEALTVRYRPSGIIFVGSEVLTTVVLKSSIFWDIMPCSPLKIKQRFGGTCCLHLQGRRISQARIQYESRCHSERHACFLLGLFFDPENGGDTFLQNAGCLSVDYTALHPRRRNSSLMIFAKLVQGPPTWNFITISPTVLMFINESMKKRSLTTSKYKKFWEIVY